MTTSFGDFDWSATPLGPPETWSIALRTTYDIMMSSQFAICATWGDEQTFFYNDGYAPFLGKRHPEAFGQPIKKVWFDIWDEIEPLINQAMAGEAAHGIDKHFVMTRNGYAEDTWWTFSYSPLRDGDKVVGFLDISIETTATVLTARQRDAAELALRERNGLLEREIAARTEAHDRFAALVEHLPVGVFLLDRDRHAVLSNPAYRQFLPHEPMPSIMNDREVAKHWRGWDDDGQPLTADRYPGARAWRGELVVPGVELLYRTGDGREIWTSVSGVPLKDASGRVHNIIGLVQDIDVQKRALETVRDLNRRLEDSVSERTSERDRALQAERSALENAERVQLALAAGAIIGTWVWYVAKDRVTVDEAFAENFGLDPALGRSGLGLAQVLETVHPDDRAGLEAATEAAIARGGRYVHQYRVRRLDGRYYWLEANGHVETGPDGTAIRFPGVLIDMEERRAVLEERDNAQKELARLAETLEQRVVERTEALQRSEEALRQAQKMEAVGQLTGGLAHDFNNLLAGISGSLEFVKRRVRQGRIRELDDYITSALDASKRAAALTHRLLAFSRRQTLAPRILDVNAMVSGMIDLIRRTVGPGIEIRESYGSDLCSVLVDQSQLESALLNLCLNARDAMHDGGVISITTDSTTVDGDVASSLGLEPGLYFSLLVTDDGAGMPPDVIAKACDPFFTTKPLGEGTGLGLSMIYGFANQSGGQVHIASEVGRGTSVTMFLPCFAGEPETSEAADNRDLIPCAKPGETILLIDDEPSVRNLLRDLLRDLGYETLEAGNGPDGMAVLNERRRIDLLVTDVGLPGGLNGRQLADAARVERPDLPILFVTGFAENSLLKDGQLEPGMAIVTKPFEIDAFAEIVREMLD